MLFGGCLLKLALSLGDIVAGTIHLYEALLVSINPQHD